MAIDRTIITPEEQRLIDLVAHAEKRARRATEKANAAIVEHEAAQRAMGAARAALDDWRDNHPGQSELPL